MNILNKTIFKDSYQFYNDLNNKNRILIINYINKNNIVREVMQEKIKNIKNKNKRDHILYKQLKNIQLSKKMLIALYYPIPRIEPNIINYIKYLLKNNYRVCLPVIENNFFGFRLIKSIDFKKIKLFNKIMQPAQSNPFCMIKDIRTIFAPCVAFNKNNFRLGHGSNFYNKILHKTKNITKYLLAYREQENNEFNVKNNYIKFNKTITC
jgi:5,10-methenyltetrahydrofolate synthetase